MSQWQWHMFMAFWYLPRLGGIGFRHKVTRYHTRPCPKFHIQDKSRHVSHTVGATASTAAPSPPLNHLEGVVNTANRNDEDLSFDLRRWSCSCPRPRPPIAIKGRVFVRVTHSECPNAQVKKLVSDESKAGNLKDIYLTYILRKGYTLVPNRGFERRIVQRRRRQSRTNRCTAERERQDDT